MALTRQQKQETVAKLKGHLSRAKSIAVVNASRLKVAHMSTLRSMLKQSGAEVVVAKKTLFRVAAKEAGLPDVSVETFPGQAAFVMSYADEVVGPKTVATFQRKHPDVQFLGGFIGHALSDVPRITELAHMKSRPEALATFAMMIRSPLSMFAGMCREPLSAFARGVQERAKQCSHITI